jgi:hypothetical protein
VKVTRSLDRIARFAFGSRQLCASQRLGSILSRVGTTRQSINRFPDFILLVEDMRKSRDNGWPLPKRGGVYRSRSSFE